MALPSIATRPPIFSSAIRVLHSDTGMMRRNSVSVNGRFGPARPPRSLIKPAVATTCRSAIDTDQHYATSTSRSLLQATSSRNSLDFFESVHSVIAEQGADDDEASLFLEAQLRLLANVAADRAQMHAILAQQRDNWNKLFQGTLTMATMTACVLSGLDGLAHSLSLSLPALLLNAGCAAMMAVINLFQPSQLAEEQRSAARLFRKLASDVDYALQVPAHLRHHTPSLLRDSQRRLQALDKAYPMPLTPGGLEKFPSKVAPPALLRAPDDATSSLQPPSLDQPMIDGQTIVNGWDERTSHDLQQLAARLRSSDINTYTTWAENVIKVNKCLAIAAPLLAASAAALNGFSSLGLLGGWGVLSALCSVLAVFAGSVSHDLQLGTVFEMYRNAAGYYAEIEASIDNALHEPPSQRENGLLFLHRVAYKVGRWSGDLQGGDDKA